MRSLEEAWQRLFEGRTWPGEAAALNEIIWEVESLRLVVREMVASMLAQQKGQDHASKA